MGVSIQCMQTTLDCSVFLYVRFLYQPMALVVANVLDVIVWIIQFGIHFSFAILKKK